MNGQQLLGRLRMAALGIAILTAGSACQRDDQSPTAPGPVGPADLALSLELSSMRVPVGQQVALAIRADAKTLQPLVALQGYLKFDPSRLQFVGQKAVAPFAIVNDQGAAQGSLRLASLEIGGLPARTATLVFQVKAADYARGLGYRLEGAATKNLARVTRVTIATAVSEAADLAVPSNAARIGLADWRAAYAVDSPSRPAGLQLSPGSYLQNLQYGDADLSGTIDIAGDAFLVANVSVGNLQLISGTNSPNRDFVIAANVDPFNQEQNQAPPHAPDIGEVGDPCRPGVGCSDANPGLAGLQQGSETGPGAVEIFDAAAIANKAVGNTVPVLGQVIPGRGPLPTNTVVLPATITTNRTLSKDTIYELPVNTIIRVGSAEPCTLASVPTLTIEAGTTIVGDSLAVMLITRCGKIHAEGTALQPIVFTSNKAGTKTAGDWGGLVLNGNAPINNGTMTSPANRGNAGGCLEQAGEGFTDTYGGCDPNDDSGMLKYVRVEYAGTRFTATNERNAVTLQGVGSATIIDYVQSHSSLDDGMEFFGGTPNVKHYLATANQDDSFDWVAGYRGKAQFVIIQGCPVGCDRGIEADNFGIDAGDPEALPRSTPILSNFTIVGQTSASAGPGTITNGILLRQNTAGFLRNMVVYRYPNGLDIDQPSGAAGGGLNLSSGICTQLTRGNAAKDDTLPTTVAGLDTLGLSFRYGLLVGNTNQGATDGADPGGPPGGPGTVAPFTCGGYSHTGSDLEAVYINPANGVRDNHIAVSAATTGVMIDAENVLTPDFRPSAGSPILTAPHTAVPTDPFFDAAGSNFAGAVDPNGIPWYAGWTRGWQNGTTP